MRCHLDHSGNCYYMSEVRSMFSTNDAYYAEKDHSTPNHLKEKIIPWIEGLRKVRLLQPPTPPRRSKGLSKEIFIAKSNLPFVAVDEQLPAANKAIDDGKKSSVNKPGTSHEFNDYNYLTVLQRTRTEACTHIWTAATAMKSHKFALATIEKEKFNADRLKILSQDDLLEFKVIAAKSRIHTAGVYPAGEVDMELQKLSRHHPDDQSVANALKRVKEEKMKKLKEDQVKMMSQVVVQEHR
ncbi:hypothetical protein B0J14DRAFT_685810 [Halenospora varia]|nr:hypothetical protein B0J14DRAFT_685810 [Halenospora varia]